MFLQWDYIMNTKQEHIESTKNQEALQIYRTTISNQVKKNYYKKHLKKQSQYKKIPICKYFLKNCMKFLNAIASTKYNNLNILIKL